MLEVCDLVSHLVVQNFPFLALLDTESFYPPNSLLVYSKLDTIQRSLATRREVLFSPIIMMPELFDKLSYLFIVIKACKTNKIEIHVEYYLLSSYNFLTLKQRTGLNASSVSLLTRLMHSILFVLCFVFRIWCELILFLGGLEKIK